MSKNNIFKIVGAVLAVVVVGCGIFLFLGNKDKNNNDNKKGPSNETVTENNKKNSNGKSDFWLADANIPSKTFDLNVKLFDDFTGAPIDLKKLDNSGYTFSYTNYDSGKSVDYNVNSISEVKGKDWYSSRKEIKVSNSSDELEFTLVVKSKCNKKEYNTYEEAINNNCFEISLNEEKVFNKKFRYTDTEGVKEIVQEIFNQLGKPTHIYVRKGDKLTMDGDGIGQLSSDIIYDYKTFKLKFGMLDTYNKKHDYRMLNFYGLSYLTNESYGPDSLNTKDIIDELVK